MVLQEVRVKTILSRSKVSDYTINPYRGCEHGCTYCYARFIQRITNHREPWGSFVDVKINAVNLLSHEIQKHDKGRVWVSGVCDPYQPIEKTYELTRSCLKILVQYAWPVTIQTKSPLVLRDLELLSKAHDVEVGLTVTTGDERIRLIFEPNAPPIAQRIDALAKLKASGVRTFAMIAPILPKSEELIPHLSGKVDYVLLDKMNYHYADWVYRNHQLESAKTNTFFLRMKQELAHALEKENIPYHILF